MGCLQWRLGEILPNCTFFLSIGLLPMIYKLPIIIFYPLALLWSLFYGGAAGFIYKLIAVYENWVAINHLQLKLWKKYPQRSYRKYIEGMWQQQIKGKPIELAEYKKLQLEKRYPEEPFPFIRLLINTVLMVLISPFMALSGLYYGPIYVYTHILQDYQLAISSTLSK